MEINDFPQNVRWRITGREMLTHLNEYCDVGVSVRGIYIPPGKSGAAPSDSVDERPLYLCLEATNERSIQIAKSEIMRIIKEELVKLVSFPVHLSCSLCRFTIFSLFFVAIEQQFDEPRTLQGYVRSEVCVINSIFNIVG